LTAAGVDAAASGLAVAACTPAGRDSHRGAWGRTVESELRPPPRRSVEHEVWSAHPRFHLGVRCGHLAGRPRRRGPRRRAGRVRSDQCVDHLWQIGPVGPVEHAMLEAYTTLGYLAAKTERVQLLTVVTAVVYREPGLLAKAVSTLDVLSGGRAMLGIGAAWNEEESRGLGLFFPRRRSGSRGWRRRCRSASRCGVMTTRRTRGNITNWAAHSTLRSHSPRGARLCRHRKDGAAALRCRRER